MKKAVLLCITYAVLFTACSSDKENKTEEKYPVINPIIMDTIVFNEYVADIHSVQNIEIRSQVGGLIDGVYVDEGKFVKAGQRLFSINSLKYSEEVTRTKALVKSAIAEAKAVELEMNNVKTLVEKQVVSKPELELAQSKLDAANAKVEEAKSNEATALLNLIFTNITAPFDGTINRIPNKQGSLVEEGTLLTTLSNNNEVLVYFKVSEREYLDITSQQNSENKTEVSLILANNTLYPHKGIIETVEGQFDKATGSIAFRARFANPNSILKHGSSGKIQLKKELKKAILIPQKSTFEIQDKNYVFVLGANNLVQMKSFIPKFRLSNFYVVESGLIESDKIIYEGIQLIKEGDKVNPQFLSTKEVLSNQVK